MLGGIDPILIYTFTTKESAAAAQSLAGLVEPPSFLENVGSSFGGLGTSLLSGLSVPIYLSESLTGIFVSSESVDIGVDNNVQTSVANDGKTKVDQKAIESSLRVDMVSTRSSVVLAALIALNEIVFARLNAKTYSISYINKSTIVLNGVLRSFSAKQSSEDTKVDVSLELGKSSKVKVASLTAIDPTRGVLP